MKLNRNYENIDDSYLFVEIAKRVAAYKEVHPEADVIRLGIGDVTLPLAPCVVEAGVKAVEEMGRAETFRGYSPDSQGYEFLRDAISKYYESFGVKVAPHEIHVSDGAKSDCGNIVDMFDDGNTVLIPDPVYPVYIDSNVMSGRKVIFCDATEDNGFAPTPDKKIKCDIIYLCSPNNPTGSVLNYEKLKEWVDYANSRGAVIIYDSAYEAFITEDGVPRSIFAVEGARTCAVELCSFSKTAGFTGTRCGYTVVPDELCGGKFAKMWARRQSTKYNGTSYIQQRMAEAAYSEEGISQCGENIAVYRKNAKVISDALDELGIFYTGGKNSPYVWLKCPQGMGSWEFFDYLLKNANVVGTPGAGFGKNGEGYFRLTAFGSEKNTEEAVKRIKNLLGT
ncbi:MAG: LL-diaminopimelate aminotransferase [Clostridia bacterium]|nr:LL-diaminopimelate aminotransferase [Clostridia bacterium]